jgi:hypothetical protein
MRKGGAQGPGENFSQLLHELTYRRVILEMKIFKVLLTGLFIIPAIFLGSARAETFENFTYTMDGTSVTITSCSGSPPALVIPSEIAGLPVRAIAGLGSTAPFPPNSWRSAVTSISIPEGVTTITGGSLRNFTSLASIALPQSVTELGPSTFSGCIALASAVLPDGLTVLDGTFSGCTALTHVTLPSGVTTLNSTFSGCISLSSIILPQSVTTLAGTFRGCTSLASIEIPENVTTLSGTFDGCTSLTNVSLPAGLTQIGADAFAGCASLLNINFLPEGLLSIADGAFRNCGGLAGVAFPAALTTIGSAAFENCAGLTELVIPETVTQIGDGAFWGCQNITSLSVPERFLASLANLGLDYNAQLATDALIAGIANNLANNPAFVTKLANEIISKTGHYGLSTQNDITTLAGMTPQTVRTVLAEIAAEQPPANAITSDLTGLSVKKGKPVQYAVTTNFNATAFSAVGLPAGMTIHPTTGVISGKSGKVGTYSVFLYAGVPAGSVVSSAKIFVVTP